MPIVIAPLTYGAMTMKATPRAASSRTATPILRRPSTSEWHRPVVPASEVPPEGWLRAVVAGGVGVDVERSPQFLQRRSRRAHRGVRHCRRVEETFDPGLDVVALVLESVNGDALVGVEAVAAVPETVHRPAVVVTKDEQVLEQLVVVAPLFDDRFAAETASEHVDGPKAFVFLDDEDPISGEVMVAEPRRDAAALALQGHRHEQADVHADRPPAAHEKEGVVGIAFVDRHAELGLSRLQAEFVPEEEKGDELVLLVRQRRVVVPSSFVELGGVAGLLGFEAVQDEPDDEPGERLRVVAGTAVAHRQHALEDPLGRRARCVGTGQRAGDTDRGFGDRGPLEVDFGIGDRGRLEDDFGFGVRGPLVVDFGFGGRPATRWSPSPLALTDGHSGVVVFRRGQAL
mmetsp:Transcript_20865/g.64465  ORF Transcript_20865/g.64465 Transcript_20865/m.64465 type:complete len:401 (+) Transcript_20865:1433-2635(+)